MQRKILQLSEIIAIAEENGGITYNPTNGDLNPKEGFAVSLDGHEVVTPELTQQVLHNFIANHKDKFTPTLYLGLWRDEGKWVLDLTVIARTIDLAIGIGRKNNQRCVYNLASGELVSLVEGA